MAIFPFLNGRKHFQKKRKEFHKSIRTVCSGVEFHKIIKTPVVHRFNRQLGLSKDLDIIKWYIEEKIVVDTSQLAKKSPVNYPNSSIGS